MAVLGRLLPSSSRRVRAPILHGNGAYFSGRGMGVSPVEDCESFDHGRDAHATMEFSKALPAWNTKPLAKGIKHFINKAKEKSRTAQPLRVCHEQNKETNFYQEFGGCRYCNSRPASLQHWRSWRISQLETQPGIYRVRRARGKIAQQL